MLAQEAKELGVDRLERVLRAFDQRHAELLQDERKVDQWTRLRDTPHEIARALCWPEKDRAKASELAEEVGGAAKVPVVVWFKADVLCRARNKGRVVDSLEDAQERKGSRVGKGRRDLVQLWMKVDLDHLESV